MYGKCLESVGRVTWLHMTLNYNTLHKITLHYTIWHFITLHYITLHYTLLYHWKSPLLMRSCKISVSIIWTPSHQLNFGQSFGQHIIIWTPRHHSKSTSSFEHDAIFEHRAIIWTPRHHLYPWKFPQLMRSCKISDRGKSYSLENISINKSKISKASFLSEMTIFAIDN